MKTYLVPDRVSIKGLSCVWDNWLVATHSRTSCLVIKGKKLESDERIGVTVSYGSQEHTTYALKGPNPVWKSTANL